jgi:ABC-type Fe3+/spermidine/putrescine transport system ATPase subunit
MALLELIDLCKTYETPAVCDIHLRLASGQIFCLLGPSGCGKTTLLRLVAGLEPRDQGQVFLNGHDISDLQAHKRQIGMMFQEFALFPHKSVFENVAFGLQMQKQRHSQVVMRTEEMLALVGLSELSQRNVADLSGGERQRVALARSLAPRPKLLMLDEPLGALDRVLRERLLTDIHTILKNLGMTAIFVTHDQTEALTVGDRVAVMNQGRIIQVDTPESLYLHPKNIFVAEFLGYKNILPGTVTDNSGVETELGTLYPPMGRFKSTDRATVVIPSDGVQIYGNVQPDEQHRMIHGKVVSRLFTGQNYRVTVAVGERLTIIGDLPTKQMPPNPGDHVGVWLDPQKMIVIRG